MTVVLTSAASRALRCSLALLVGLAAVNAAVVRADVNLAAELGHADDHLHRPLAEDQSLRLSDSVDAALASYPSIVEAPARDEEARAWRDRGTSLIAGPPQFSFRYQTDRYDDDVGLQEFESGLQLPLWRWGQRRATQTLGSTLGDASVAWQAALMWQVAGQVRELFWDLAVARGELEIARRAHDVSNRLLTAVERRYELGDVALGDVLLAQTTEAASRTVLTDAEAAVVDAERSYRVLTGLDRRPAFTAEAKSARREIPSEHPALVLVNAEVERARAAQAVARHASQTAPTLMIGPRRERPAGFGQAFEDSIGFFVTVPFGGSSHTRTQVAAAGRATAGAEADRRQMLRGLELALHEAEHGLEVAAKNLADAERRQRIAEQAFSMGESAYASGEIGLFELMNLQNLLLEAGRQRLRYDVEAKRLTAMYNQALGELP